MGEALLMYRNSKTYWEIFGNDTEPPVVTFTPNGNTTARDGQSTKVTIVDNEDILYFEYQWTNSSTFPDNNSWSNAFNGSTLTCNQLSGGYHYLHVKVSDSSGNESRVTSNPFNLTAIPFTVESNFGELTITGIIEKTNRIIIPEKIRGMDVVAIGDRAFEYNSGEPKITTLSLPSTIKEIGNYAFSKQAIYTVDLPSSVEKVGDQAFDSNNTTRLVLREGLLEIGAWAFGINSFISASVPASVRRVGSHAFGRCGALSNITFLSMDSWYGDDVIIDTNSPTVKGYDGSTIQTYAQQNGYTFQVL